MKWKYVVINFGDKYRFAMFSILFLMFQELIGISNMPKLVNRATSKKNSNLFSLDYHMKGLKWYFLFIPGLNKKDTINNKTLKIHR